jgi:hypothetical protein
MMSDYQRRVHCERLAASALTAGAREHYAVLAFECCWFLSGDEPGSWLGAWRP